MGNPEEKAKRSFKRKRNFVAKRLLEDRQFSKKIHLSKKDRDKQRKWRLGEDPSGDYENLDDWILRDA